MSGEVMRGFGGVRLSGTETIRQFEVPGLAQYSYLIASQGEAIVIDAARDIDIYTSYAAEHGLRITHVTETHIHADFASGSAALAAATGAELAVSGYDHGEIYRYSMLHRKLRDGDSISIGRLRLQPLHTPGHTPEHLSFVLFDPDLHGSSPVAIFTGDFLFAGSLGRPDLLGEESKVALAHDLFRSARERIAHLPNDVVVYPGHGAGSLCGAGIGSSAKTTLGYERSAQPLLRLTQQEFVAEVLATIPPLPVYYPRMKRLNAAGAQAYDAAAPITALEAAEVASHSSSGDTVLLDVRDVESFAQSHIPGAISLGAGDNLPLWAGWLLQSQLRLVLIDQAGSTAEMQEVRRALARVGLDQVDGMLADGMQRWLAEGRETRTVPLMDSAKLDAADVLLLDVRSADEWSARHIPGTLNIPLGDLPQRLAGLPKGRDIVTVCGSGYRASAAASLVAAAGLPVASLRGGMAAWEQSQLTVAAEKPFKLNQIF
jgi:hydroxyacylglutathione hydrolase